MKDFFGKLFTAIIVLILIAIVVYNVISTLAPIVNALGYGSIIKGIILSPFGIFGIVQFFRGSLKVLSSDLENMEDAKYPTWLLFVYFFVNLFSVVALIEVCRSLL